MKNDDPVGSASESPRAWSPGHNISDPAEFGLLLEHPDSTKLQQPCEAQPKISS